MRKITKIEVNNTNNIPDNSIRKTPKIDDPLNPTLL